MVLLKITEAELALRKDRIIHTAFQLFCCDGIDNVSIKDVAEAAQVGEKSIYRYFSSKMELVMATVTVLWKEVVAQLVASVDSDYRYYDGLGQIACLLRCMNHLFENHASYIFFSFESRIFFARHGAKITEELYADELQPIEALYIGALNKGMDDGSIALRGDPEDLYYSIWGLMRGYVAKIVVYDRMYAGENIWRGRFRLACSLILGGLEHGFPARANA